MDAQALLTPDAVEREMGRPLLQVPDPAGDCHASYARHFAGLFIDTFSALGIHPERYYWMSDIYPTGEMDPFIRTALNQAATVREIYRRVANVQHPDAWHPLQVVCENCGKLGTTIVTDWDGELVKYECRAHLVTWATGCGHSGWVSPFGGRAKLPWNLEWAAQWSLFGVTIEPCGKDLSTAGGSRDRSDAIAREVFEREPPLNVPYEFINIGGKKMSTSKGLGAAAHEIVDVIKPEQLRFFFLRPKPNHAVDFDPIGNDAVPRLYDEFDRFAAATAGKEVRGEIAPGFENTFRYSLLDANADVTAEAAKFRPAFGHLALLLQIPNVDVAERMAAEKGSALDEREAYILDERVEAARGWLASYAPDKARLEVRRDALPADAAALDDGQRSYLARPGRRRRRRATGRRRRVAERDLRRGDAGRARCEDGVRGDLPRVPRPDERPARGLAAREPRRGVRRSSGCARRRPRLWEVRHERWAAAAARGRGRDPQGRDRQGRGPGDRRPGDRGRRAAPPAPRRRRHAQSGAERRVEGDRRARSRAARSPTAPRWRSSAAAPSKQASGSPRSTRSSADVEAQVEDLMLRIPNPADPEVPIGGEEANVTVRTWGEQLPVEQPLEGEVGADAPRAARRGAGSPTGRSPRRSTSSICRAARRSPAPASRSTRAPGRGSSGR